MEQHITPAPVATTKLPLVETLKEGVSLALKNYLNIILTVLLYVVTVWIPYLNVGTTIALSALPAELAKGNKLNPTYIFNAKYRKNMGEFFILNSLMLGGILVGLMFMVIPAFVISLAWGLAILLFVDKNKSALEALRESNRITYGNKLNIFLVSLIIGLAVGIVNGLITLLCSIGYVPTLMTIGSIITNLITIAVCPIYLAVNAVIYKKLVLDEEVEA